MELRINIHANKNDFLLYVDGQEKQVAYDATRKTYYVYADVENGDAFEIILKNKPLYPMSWIRHLLSMIVLFWFFIVMEISGFGKDGTDWKCGISLYEYNARFQVKDLKDKEVNIRYDGNHFQKGAWLKPRFVIADEANLQLQYHMSLSLLDHGFQKYWMFFGSLNVCFLFLMILLFYVMSSGTLGIFASLCIAFALIVAAVFFGMSDYRIIKDYCYHRALVQADGEKHHVYEESFK